MRISTRVRRTAVVAAGTAALTLAGLAGTSTTAQAVVVAGDETCVVPDAGEPAGAASRGGHGPDTRPVSVAEQRQISERTERVLDRRSRAAAGGSIPVYVHVMRAEDGRGNVTNDQVQRQVRVLNKTFGGRESDSAAETGFTFTLAGIDRFRNNAWHKDRRSAEYRTKTRQGGAEALNIWLVEFEYLGVATFPWDYPLRPEVDGIRVHFGSLPGGPIPHYNKGETTTHEAGHWLGLFHTFQGGCTPLNDEVADTPAQKSATEGCPARRNSCPLPGRDPIHNYMDYSYDTCYTEFTADQSARMSEMFTAYRS